MNLSQGKVGKSYRVIKIHGSGPLRRRVMDMGITKGLPVTVSNLAPFGDPIELTLRGYQLTIRRENAEIIEVEEMERGQLHDH